MTTATIQEPSPALFADSFTMLRRNLLHMRRYPSMVFSILIMPTVLLLVFNYVFGGALEAGLEPGTKYINYLAPGMLLLLPAYLTVSVAVSLATDSTKGIVNRFRVMSIAQSAMLTGHVVGTLIQGALAMGGMIGVALLMGFRPDATPLEWVAVFGLLMLVVFAFTWLAVAFGLAAPNPESEQYALPDRADAVPRQRPGAHRHHADGAALVRRIPAVHPDHRNRARTADGHRDRRQRARLAGLVRGHRRGGLRVVDGAVQEAGELSAAPSIPCRGRGSSACAGQLRSSSIGCVASSDSGNGCLRSTSAHRSVRRVVMGSLGSAESTIQSSCSSSPSS